jgi:hypothetical protein
VVRTHPIGPAIEAGSKDHDLPHAVSETRLQGLVNVLRSRDNGEKAPHASLRVLRQNLLEGTLKIRAGGHERHQFRVEQLLGKVVRIAFPGSGRAL